MPHFFALLEPRSLSDEKGLEERRRIFSLGFNGLWSIVLALREIFLNGQLYRLYLRKLALKLLRDPAGLRMVYALVGNRMTLMLDLKMTNQYTGYCGIEPSAREL